MPPRAGHSSTLIPRLRRDGSAVTDVRFRAAGKQKSMTFDSPAAAKRFQAIIEKVGAVEALKYMETGEGDTPTVYAFAEKFIRGKSGVEGKTTDDYERFMRTSIGPAFGDLPMNAVTRELIADWINEQARAGLAHKTIKNRHSFLSSMYKRAIEDDVPGVIKNPAHGARIPQTVSDAEMTFLEPWEFNVLMSFIPEQYLELVLTLAGTGMRWGEATALGPRDFDFTNGTVRVVKAWKKSREQGYYIGPPKTKKSRRTISLPPGLVPVLEAHVANNRHDFVFTNKNGGPVRQATFWEKAWAPARNLANGRPAFDESSPRFLHGYIPRTGGTWDKHPSERPIHKEPRVHDLRHSHVSWLLAEGVALDVVQQRLGHESITTTVDRYGHIASDRLFDSAKQIDHVLAPSVRGLVSLAPSRALTDAEAGGVFVLDPNDAE
jgi:integrase